MENKKKEIERMNKNEINSSSFKDMLNQKLASLKRKLDFKLNQNESNEKIKLEEEKKLFLIKYTNYIFYYNNA